MTERLRLTMMSDLTEQLIQARDERDRHRATLLELGQHQACHICGAVWHEDKMIELEPDEYTCPRPRCQDLAHAARDVKTEDIQTLIRRINERE